MSMVYQTTVHWDKISCLKYIKNRKEILCAFGDGYVKIFKIVEKVQLPTNPNDIEKTVYMIKSLKTIRKRDDDLTLLVLDHRDLFVTSGDKPDLDLYSLK